MVELQKQTAKKRPKLVGSFIRQKREALGLSQRALGQMFTPAVTTQFISNVERGATPLPPAHIPTLATALQVAEEELMTVLEREYAIKLSGRFGNSEDGILSTGNFLMNDKDSNSKLAVSPGDLGLMKSLYDAYKRADEKDKNAFLSVCRSILGLNVESDS